MDIWIFLLLAWAVSRLGDIRRRLDEQNEILKDIKHKWVKRELKEKGFDTYTYEEGYGNKKS